MKKASLISIATCVVFAMVILLRFIYISAESDEVNRPEHNLEKSQLYRFLTNAFLQYDFDLEHDLGKYNEFDSELSEIIGLPYDEIKKLAEIICGSDAEIYVFCKSKNDIISIVENLGYDLDKNSYAQPTVIDDSGNSFQLNPMFWLVCTESVVYSSDGQMRSLPKADFKSLLNDLNQASRSAGVRFQYEQYMEPFRTIELSRNE